MFFVWGNIVKYQKHQIENVTRSELEHLIDEYVIGFKAERNRVVMKRRLCDGVTFEKIAEETDMSVRQIKKIVYDIQPIILKHVRVED